MFFEVVLCSESNRQDASLTAGGRGAAIYLMTAGSRPSGKRWAGMLQLLWSFKELKVPKRSLKVLWGLAFGP